tara:strand:+ start:223 stop:636 length:414 start_codon:yes stop_codon:yes gene_type:complete
MNEHPEYSDILSAAYSRAGTTFDYDHGGHNLGDSHSHSQPQPRSMHSKHTHGVVPVLSNAAPSRTKTTAATAAAAAAASDWLGRSNPVTPLMTPLITPRKEEMGEYENSNSNSNSINQGSSTYVTCLSFDYVDMLIC